MNKLLFVALFVCLSAVTALAQEKPAQQKPDFNGTWKLNVSKSDFGVLGGPDSRTDVITHKEPSITDQVSADGQQGKAEYTIKYTTDGKENTNQINGREVKSTLKWDANNLKITSKFSFNDNDVDAEATWSLSPDGKTLTIEVHYASALGNAEQKLVLEKQETVPPAPKTP
ncbi:MAG TPA: hypothetical protein VGN86_03905 [Pyrinomonadaceae bacterium]|jgi:hypothetical protein|nr:hypothetical protein [Pyrinomonadaceae bacterium]